MAVAVAVGMNGSRVKKASGQWSALSAKARDGTSHTRMTEQKPKCYNVRFPEPQVIWLSLAPLAYRPRLVTILAGIVTATFDSEISSKADSTFFSHMTFTSFRKLPSSEAWLRLWEKARMGFGPMMVVD